MKADKLPYLAGVIAAFHVVVLAFVLGTRHFGYLLTAALSATLIWAVVLFPGAPKRSIGILAGLAAGLLVQQVAYQVWKAGLPGFWWPLAQFAALQYLVAYAIGKTAS